MGDVDLWKSSNIRKQSTRNLMYMEHLRICQGLEIRQLCQNGTNAKDLSIRTCLLDITLLKKENNQNSCPFMSLVPQFWAISTWTMKQE